MLAGASVAAVVVSIGCASATIIGDVSGRAVGSGRAVAAVRRRGRAVAAASR